MKGHGLGSSPVVQGAIKQYFLLLLPTHPIRLTMGAEVGAVLLPPKKPSFNSGRTDIVDGPFPR